MDVCKNFTLSLTGGFQECRNCGREKKFHKLDFENNTIEYVPKTTNNNAAKFQQEKLQQIAVQKQVEEDELRAKACDKFELALRGQFQQCGNCGIEKKYHKLDTSGQIPYQPKQSFTKSVQQNVNKPAAVAEIVQEAMMVQSVKDRVAQMNKNVQKPSEPQFRPSIKKEEVKEKAPGQAEIVTDQLFTSVQDQKSVFNKQRNKKTIEEATHFIREQNQTHHQESADFKKAESQYIQSSEQQENNEQQQQHNYEQHQQEQQQQQQDQQQEVYQQNEEQHVEQVEEQHVEQTEEQHVEQVEEQQVEQQVEQAEEQQVEQTEEQQVQQPEEDQENQDIY